MGLSTFEPLRKKRIVIKGPDEAPPIPEPEKPLTPRWVNNMELNGVIKLEANLENIVKK